ncbi:hypothetical protein F8M41_007529 [Gigaspora margarita]|uniref:Restriction of telomere capping protein 4 n=1 Tax=Gigaspora margarita TaxID=4874 RepID=A0A8H4AW57_GIGMA|nr:hypothetical protein F8M41_007529 [Gigaspora margarita]
MFLETKTKYLEHFFVVICSYTIPFQYKFNLEFYTRGSKNSTIIDISDSDEDELPSLETVLKNISKFTGYKKSNNIEFIEIQDDTTAANYNNDDFTYTNNDVRFLRIIKKTIRSKLKGMVQRLKSKKAIRYIAEICKHKERYKYYNDFKSLSKWHLRDLLAIDRLVPGYYGMKGYTLMYEHLMKNTAEWEPNLEKDINKQEFMQEVIIPELGVMFIMTDLKVNNYETAVIITHKSVEYSNQNFFGDKNDACFW